MRKIPRLEEWYPNFSEEFEKTKLPSVMERVTTEEPPLPKASQPRPEGWWREYPHSLWIVDRGREPTAYELLHDFIVGKTMTSPLAISIGSTPPSRLILFEVKHPTRGVEYARIFLNPTDVMEGYAEEEPDVVVRIGYYDLVAVLCGELPPFNPLYEGRVEIIGNTVAAIDLLCDVLEATNGREAPPGSPTPIPRPVMWPLGHP
jgi:hypothetical protein